MNESNQYDGTGKLAEAIANLCGLSPKSQGQIAALIKQAKAGLGIASKSKNLPTDTKLAIYQWHYDRLHQVTVDSVELFSQPIQPDTVDIISQADSNQCVEINSQDTLDNAPVEIFSQPNDLDIVRVAFYVTKDSNRTRQVIALDGFYINGLMLATGITKADVPKWVQAAVDSCAAFDAHLPITRQVKLLIVRELTKAYC